MPLTIKPNEKSCIVMHDDYVLWEPNPEKPPSLLLTHPKFRQIVDEFFASPESGALLRHLRLDAHAQPPKSDDMFVAEFLLSIQFGTRLNWNKAADSVFNEYIRKRAMSNPDYVASTIEVRGPQDYEVAKVWLEKFYYNASAKHFGEAGYYLAATKNDYAGHPILVVLKAFKRSLLGNDKGPELIAIWDISRIRVIKGSTVDCVVHYDGVTVPLVVR